METAKNTRQPIRRHDERWRVSQRDEIAYVALIRKQLGLEPEPALLSDREQNVTRYEASVAAGESLFET